MEGNSESLAKKIKAWETRGNPTNVCIRGKENAESGKVFIKTWTPIERRLRGLKVLLIWWGIALLSVLVPILHFITVPFFIVGGIIMAPFISTKKSVVLGGFGVCPFCSQTLEIVKSPNTWPLRDLCSACGRHVEVEKA